MAFHAVREDEPVMRFLVVMCLSAWSCGGNSVVVTGGTDGGSRAGGSAAGGSSGGGSTAGGSAGGTSSAGGSAGGTSSAGGSAGGTSSAGGSAGGTPSAGGSAGGTSSAGGSAGGTSSAGGSAGGTPSAGGSAGGATGGGSAGGSVANVDAGIARPIGVNMPNLLHMYLGIAPEGPAEARAQMDRARAAGFTHARFIASGYWPVDMTRANGWRTNPALYWQAVDQLMADARARQLRLVPSLLWNAWLFPDLNNQPLSAMFTPGSATRTMADQYVREFVQRYASEPAVAVWEIGNEWNLLADLDFSTCTVCAGSTANSCAALAPSLGTPCRRVVGDNIFSCNSCRNVSSPVQDLGQWAQAVAQLIKQHDPLQRPVSTGHAYPRPSASHLARSPCPACNWTADTETEFALTLAQLHPSPIDFISVHSYPGDENKRFGDTDTTGFALLQRTQTAATSLGKKLYVGEYGEPRAGSITCNGVEACNGDPLSASTRMMALGLVQYDVAFSALWAFDFHQFCAATPTCYGVEANEPLATFLSTAERAALQCRGQPDAMPCATGRCLSGTCRPVAEGTLDLEAAGSEASWLNWTNCSSCTLATFQRVPVGPRFAVQLSTDALPCTGACQFPGGYALSPPIPITAGHRQVLVRAEVGSTSAAAKLRLIGLDAAATEVSSQELSIPVGSLSTRYAVFSIPLGVTNVRLRLEQPAPNAQVTLDAVSISTLP